MITLREAMDRLFDDAFTRPFGVAAGSLVPPIDMYQTEEDVVVKAVLPGMKAEDVQISVTGELLSIKGEYSQAEETERSYQIREQQDMPRYDFACHTCGRKFETSLPLGASRQEVRCPVGHRRVQRIFSPAAVILTGSGFHRTDSRRGPAGGPVGSS